MTDDELRAWAEAFGGKNPVATGILRLLAEKEADTVIDESPMQPAGAFNGSYPMTSTSVGRREPPPPGMGSE